MSKGSGIGGGQRLAIHFCLRFETKVPFFVGHFVPESNSIAHTLRARSQGLVFVILAVVEVAQKASFVVKTWSVSDITLSTNLVSAIGVILNALVNGSPYTLEFDQEEPSVAL